MTRIIFSPRVNAPATQPDSPNTIAEARINRGMNSYIDAADLENGMLSLAVNASVYADKTFRTPGSAAITPTKPNALAILTYVGWKRFDTSTEYLRFTKNTLHKKGAGSWTALTGTALTGTDTDRIRWMTISDATRDWFIYTNNGVDEIQTTNTALTTFSDLGAVVPKAKFITGFFNRVVAANIMGASPNPILLKWSGDLNFTEWNPSTDVSAGSTPLVEAQADYSDAITGLFGFASVMLILRERSLWTATKRPVASNPFLFTAAFPSVGCDTPNSATQTRNGICWYDRRANQVYSYEVGSAPQPVGDPVRELISQSYTNKDLVHASFDVENNTYVLTIPSSISSTTRIFKLNLTNLAWTYDEKMSVYATTFLDAGVEGILIDNLAGTINGLAGVINSLVGSNVPSGIFYGMTDGDIYQASTALDGGTLRLESKVFRGSSDTIISRLMLLLMPKRAGTVSVYYRRNGGDWNLYKNVTLGAAGSRQRIYCVKTLLCNDYQWAVSCSSGDFSILEYKIETVSNPEDK